MAGNKKNAQSKKGGHGQQHADVRGSVTDNIKNAEIGRARARNLRHQNEGKRAQEVQSGRFYSRINNGRSRDVVAACNGEIGEYAFPGGDTPSVHVSVSKEVGPNGAMSVIRFEAPQRGHELEGAVFDSTVFLPAHYVRKFGTSYTSNKAGLVGKTQNLICHYMAKLLENPASFEKEDEPKEVTIEELYARVKTSEDNIRNMVYDDVLGEYGFKTGYGTLIVSSFVKNGKAAIKVKASSVPGVEVSDAYLYTYLLHKKTLDQYVDDETYGHQLNLFTFLQNNMPEKAAKRLEVVLKENGRPMGKKELAKRAAAACKSAKAKPLNVGGEIDSLKVEEMKRHAIPLRDAALLGKMGFVTLGHSSGEMVVFYGQVGVDKVVRIDHLSESHVLRLAGCEVGMSVYIGQIMVGEIDRIDQINHKMTAGQVISANAFIRHLREQLAEIRVSFPDRKGPNLRLVKAA